MKKTLKNYKKDYYYQTHNNSNVVFRVKLLKKLSKTTNNKTILKWIDSEISLEKGWDKRNKVGKYYTLEETKKMMGW